MRFGSFGSDHGGARRLVPDLDDEMVFVLAQVEEVLLTLSAWESDPDAPAELPAPLAGRRALEALNRVQALIAPTQTRIDRNGGEILVTVGPDRLLGPDGRYEHRPLRLVALDQADLPRGHRRPDRGEQAIEDRSGGAAACRLS